MLKKVLVSAAASLLIFGAAAILPSGETGTQVIGSLITVDAASYDISSYTASIPYSSYTYRGRGIKPTVTVKDKSGKKLTKDTDFTVSYSNNTNVGTATITINGKGKYTGTLKKTFKVKQLNLSSSYAKVTIPYSSYTYSGSTIKPEVKVKFKDGDLIPTTQYTLSYSNNVKVGTATITVKGKGGNVMGTYKKTFVVKPAKNAIKGLTAGVGSFKLTWTKATAGATGYQVLYSTDKNFVNNVHSYTSTDLNDLSENFSKVPEPGETWYVKVRSFVTKDGKTTSTRYGNYSEMKSVKIGSTVPTSPVGRGYVYYTYCDVDNDGVKELIEVYYNQGGMDRNVQYRIYEGRTKYKDVLVEDMHANADYLIYDRKTGKYGLLGFYAQSQAGMIVSDLMRASNGSAYYPVLALFDAWNYSSYNCYKNATYYNYINGSFVCDGTPISYSQMKDYLKNIDILYSYLDPQHEQMSIAISRL